MSTRVGDRAALAFFVSNLHEQTQAGKIQDVEAAAACRMPAQRGKLDPLYQDLSDRLTLVLQRLYPVWALAGPGLSDPGHIEVHSRSIYLDADELLGPRDALIAGELPRRHVLRTFGVAFHETFHGKHTKRWTVERTVA